MKVWSQAGLALGLALYCCLPGQAQPPADIWQQPAFSADPAAMARAAAAIPLPKDADVEYFFDDTLYRLEPDGRTERAVHRIYRLLTGIGVEKNSAVEVPWSPWYEERPKVRARVITADGQEHLLDPELLAEAPSPDNSPLIWHDDRTLTAPLPATDVGTLVEVEESWRDSKPAFPLGLSKWWPVGSYEPTHKARLTLEFPKDIPLRYMARATELVPQRREHNGWITLAFETEPKRWVLPERYLPRDYPRHPEIAFSTGRSWSDVVAGYVAMVERQLEKPGVESLVRAEVGSEKDRRKIAVKLLAAVHRLVRYTGVEFGDAGIVPRAPRQVLARRFGDCKDQSALLVAMLRAAGLQANLALVSAGSARDAIPDLPGMGHFNHVIVCLPDDPPIWIDPTARYLPMGRLTSSVQGRWALVARRDSARLVRTPVYSYRETTVNQVCELRPDAKGHGVAKVTLSSTGAFAETHREICSSASHALQQKLWELVALTKYRFGKLAQYRYENLEDLDKPFTVSLEIHDAEIALARGADLQVPLDITPLLGQLPGLSGRKRVAPMLLPHPQIVQLTYHVIAPPTYTLAAQRSWQTLYVPVPQYVSSARRFGPVTISREIRRLAPNEIIATFRLDTGPGLLTPADADALRHGLRRILSDQDNEHWEGGVTFRDMLTEFLSRGQVKELLEESRRLLRNNPKQPDVRRTYVLALLGAGMGEAARQEAGLLAAADPKSALAQKVLGDALSSDQLGRWFAPGMDRAGALAAYRKSLEIDPQQSSLRCSYARLLTYGSDNVVFSPGANIDEAISQLKQAYRDAPNFLAAQQLATLLFNAGRYAELNSFTAQTQPPITWQAILVAAAADDKGEPQAELLAAQTCRDLNQRITLLRQAVTYLQRSRRYAAALAIEESLLRQGNGSDKTPKITQSLQRVQKVDVNLDLPIANPSQLVRTYLGAAWLGGNPSHELGRLLLSGTTAEDLDAARERAVAGIRSRLEQYRLLEVSPAHLADALSVLTGRIDGNDGLGYRVQISNSLTLYAIIESGVYRMVEPGPLQTNMADIAMRCLNQHNPVPATLWLNWALEEQRAAAVQPDPFAKTPFAGLWPTLHRDEPEDIRLAAAALLAERPSPYDIIPILLEGRAFAHAGAQTLHVQRALARAFDHADRYEDWLSTAELILNGYPRAPEAIAQRMSALWCLGRSRAQLPWLREQIRQMTTAGAYEYLAVLSARVGDFRNANRIFVQLAGLGQISPAGLNSFAWNSIFLREVNQSSLDAAAKASNQFKNEHPAYLNTLATIDAELGRNADALKTLQLCVSMRSQRITDSDWYVLGRIAENYGLTEVAADLYRKVAAPKRRWADDVYQLAQWRLKMLNASPWQWLWDCGPRIDELPGTARHDK